MAIRTVNYNVSASGITPSEIMWGGVQHEHNATRIKYMVGEELLSTLNGEIRFRIDFNSHLAGYQPGENTLLDENNSVSREIPQSITQYGGEITASLVISRLDENDLTQSLQEILTIPAPLFLTGAPRKSQRVVESLSAFEEYVASLATGTKASEENAKAHASDAESSCISASESASKAEEQAQEAQKQAEASEKSAQSAADTLKEIENEKKLMAQSFSNALKGEKSGNAVKLDDISPLSHQVEITVEHNWGGSVDGVNVSVLGKNLLDSAVYAAESWDSNFLFEFMLPKGTYTISGAYDTSITTHIYLQFFDFATGSWVNKNNAYFLTGTKSENTMTFAVEDNEPLALWILKPAHVPYIKFLQIEEGSKATEYEEYVQPQSYTADENGIIHVNSLYPSLSVLLRDENRHVSVKYIRDINKAIASLESRLNALGASV